MATGLGNAIQRGLAASRPASGDATKAGQLYYATDTKVLYHDNGTAWLEVGTYASILAAVVALSATGLVARTGSGTVAARSIAAATGLAVTDGDGASGNPTIAPDIGALTADATPDGAADYVMTYDTSAAAHKKVLLDNLPGGGGGGGAALTVKELDGSPSDAAVTEIRVPNGSLSSVSSGVVALDFGSPLEVLLSRTLIGVGGVAAHTVALSLTDYDHVVIRARLRGEVTTGGAPDVWCRLNADSASDYAYTLLLHNGTTAPTRLFNLNDSAGLHLGAAPRGDYSAGSFASITADILGANSTTMRKVCHARSSYFDGTSTYLATQSDSEWRGTAALTSLTLYLAAGDIAEGSLICVYGIKAV